MTQTITHFAAPPCRFGLVGSENRETDQKTRHGGQVRPDRPAMTAAVRYTAPSASSTPKPRSATGPVRHLVTRAC